MMGPTWNTFCLFQWSGKCIDIPRAYYCTLHLHCSVLGADAWCVMMGPTWNTFWLFPVTFLGVYKVHDLAGQSYQNNKDACQLCWCISRKDHIVLSLPGLCDLSPMVEPTTFGPIRFAGCDVIVNLIGACDLAGWKYSDKQPEIQDLGWWYQALMNNNKSGARLEKGWCPCDLCPYDLSEHLVG